MRDDKRPRRLFLAGLAGLALLMGCVRFLSPSATVAQAQEPVRKRTVKTIINDHPTATESNANSFAAAPEQGSLVVSDLTNKKPEELVNNLLGAGVAVSNVSFRGATRSAGFFTGGANIIGFDQGIILSTGAVQNVVGPNRSTETTTVNETQGDAQLNQLIPGLTTNDATVLEFDFVPTGSTVTFQYVFASEEYNEFVNSEFNDLFGFFLNGQNIAVLPGTNVSVSINNVNGGKPLGTNPKNPQFYVNNDRQDGSAPLNTEMDGLTVVLSVQAAVKSGQTNRLKLAIADASDFFLDSNVFIKAASFTTQPTKQADLQITQSATPNPVTAGGTVTFDLTVRNAGPDAADAVTVTDGLPAAATFISCTASNGGACGGSGNNRTISFASLAAGASVTARIVAKFDCTAGGEGGTTNIARVSSATADNNQANNTATVAINVQGAGGQLTLVSGKTSFEFGPVVAAREPVSNPPSDTFTIENPGCGSVALQFAMNRTGSAVSSGRIGNPDDSATFPLRLINANGTETAIPTGPGAAPVQLPAGQRYTFRVQFNPLIPILAGKTSSLFANQAIPDVVTSQLSIASATGTPIVLNLTGRVATAVKLTHPSDARQAPLLQFTRSGDEFTIECTTHDANHDLKLARYQFLNANEQAVGFPVDVDLAQAIAARDLVRGQSFSIAMVFTGALSRPEIRKMRVTLFDNETNVSSTSTTLDLVEPTVASVSAASFAATAVASESIVSAFGNGLAGGIQVAASTPLPTSLTGVSVRVRDGAGIERAAPLFFVSPGQINYQVPVGTMVGAATVTVTRDNQTVARSGIQVAGSSPGLFAANANGQGAAAAVALRIGPNGKQQYEAVTQFDSAQNRVVTRTLNFGTGREDLYLLLFGTGLRYRRAGNVTVSIGGVQTQALYAGAQGGFVGLDQINVLVPRSLAGRGEVDVTVTIDGRTSNTVRVRFGGASSAAADNQPFTVRATPASAASDADERAVIRLPKMKIPPALDADFVSPRSGNQSKEN